MTRYQIEQGDISKWLDQYEGEPFHAALFDPPYALIENSKRFSSPDAKEPSESYAGGAFKRQAKGFMSSTWDGFESLADYQRWVTEWARKLHRVMHPGAVGAAFGGSRTWHRLAVGLEDAGLEIVDTIIWAYGSGMPKSLNIGRAIDKRAGFTAAKRKQLKADGQESTRRATSVTHGDYGDKSETYEAEYFTPEGQRWSGHGTLLKPAYEPVIIFRVPRGKLGFIDLAQIYGTGALNIDAARLPVAGSDEAGRFPANVVLTHSPDCQFIGHKVIKGSGSGVTVPTGGITDSNVFNPSGNNRGQIMNTTYRDPDGNETVEEWKCVPGCPVREINLQSGELRPHDSNPTKPGGGSNMFEGINPLSQTVNYTDSGGAARFFYSGKAATWERNLSNYLSPSDELTPDQRAELLNNLAAADYKPKFGSIDIFDPGQLPTEFKRLMQPARCTHPTVKPIELTTYLAKLLLPPDGQERRLLIPFSGVGSEMIGGALTGWEFIQGIELTPDYIPQAYDRLKWWSQFNSYESAQLAYNQKKDTARESVALEKAREKAGVRQVPLMPEE